MSLNKMPPNYQWHRLIIFCFLFVLSTPSFSQEKNQSLDDLIRRSNQVYGADDRLDFGKIYKPINMPVINHPFLISGNWNKGTIYINGIKFKNAYLKFNIAKDEIFYKGDNPSAIILTKSYIDSLRINNRLLINSNKIPVINKMGFIELLHKGRYISYLKHKIGVTHVSTTNSISLKYMTPKFVLYMQHKDQLIIINSKKSLLHYFAPNKKDIQRFLKSNKIRFKKATWHQLKLLLKYCDSLQTNSEIE